MEFAVGFGVIALFLLIWVISTFNRFTRLSYLMKDSWANVDVALKRRHDLIPNLVETVKGYAAHELAVLTRLVEARNGAASGSTVEQENELSHSLSAVLMRAEAYPELKSNKTYLKLMEELVNTEDRIAAARRFYNANVRDFNILRESFPSSLLSGGRPEAQPFEIESVDVRKLIHITF